MLYTPTKVAVAADQLEKLKREISNGGKKNYVSIKIQLKNKQGHSVMAEQHTLLLTRAQIASIEKVRSNGNRRFKTVRMSRQQVAKNVSHHGGILGFLASLASRALPALAKGLATGLLGGVAQQLTGGGQQHGQGLYLFKRGHCIKVDPVKGHGLYLRSHPSGDGATMGDGLYLNRGGSGGGGMQAVSGGDGLILGKNSPFKNIPILGWIL